MNKMSALSLFSKPLSISHIPSLIYNRSVSTTAALLGKRNFRKFLVYNKRGSLEHRLKRRLVPDYDLGVRAIGVFKNNRFVVVPEMIPEIVVPDMTGFKLKPYVSYRVPDVVQSEFTAKDLFDACYADKIVEDFKMKKLDENGDPIEPSIEEAIKPEDAFKKARQTGCDMFYQKLNIKV